jgi:peptidoglycan-associated lipoprotein
MKNNRPLSSLLPALALATIVLAAGCGKKAPAPPPPPPAPVASNPAPEPSERITQRAVISQFTIEPATIERGQTAVLRWTVANSTDIAINNGIGTVPGSGTRNIIPAETTTYTITANSPLGNATATATVTVTGPPPPPTRTPAPRSTGTLESRVLSDLRDAYFDYDSNNIREEARAALLGDLDALKRILADFPNAAIAIEGHCDERGSAEYNLGLGDRRSTSARDFLVQQGIPADKLKTISYGKERPVCTEASEECWQKNRRAHFAAGQ